MLLLPDAVSQAELSSEVFSIYAAKCHIPHMIADIFHEHDVGVQTPLTLHP